MTTDIAIDSAELGRRLQASRKVTGRRQQEVADALGVSRPTLAAIEAGQRRLDARMLVSLARAYGIPLSDLVKESPPAVALQAQFRLNGDAGGPDREQLERAVSKLETRAAAYLQLERLLENPLRSSPNPPHRYSARRLEQDAESIADAERRRLGLGDGPLLRLRELLERTAGMRIFCLELPSAVGALYGVSADAGPCVALNINHAGVRQRWSLAHEYGHLLTHLDRPEVTRTASYLRMPEHERFAERFAACFLMPRAGLERRVYELENADQNVTIADLLLIADQYEVSFQALVLRLEDLGVLPANTWDLVSNSGANIQAASKILGVRPLEPDAQRFPRRFIYLAVTAYERGLLTERQLADILEEDRLTVRELREQLSAAQSDAGNEDLPVDLSTMIPVGGRS